MDIRDQIIAVLERAGPSTIQQLAKETHHGSKIIIKILDLLRVEGRVIATIPEEVPVARISPGRAVWVLIPPDNKGRKKRGNKNLEFDGEWEPL